ncbi:unnamed protein product, partial [Ceratitis capitata]
MWTKVKECAWVVGCSRRVVDKLLTFGTLALRSVKLLNDYICYNRFYTFYVHEL